MSFRLILFIIIQLAALFFFIEMLRRIVKRVNEYHLVDTRQTLPFGFLRLRHVIILYIIFYLLWVVFSAILYVTFIDTTSSYHLENRGGGGAGSVNLNL